MRNVAEAAAALSELGDRVILALDTYERFRMLDTWFRRVFAPSLQDNVRLLLFGRDAPVAAWHVTPGWDQLFRSFRLGPLNNQEAGELLVRLGMHDQEARRINGFLHGHPLALKLAATAAAERPDLNLTQVVSRHVVAELVNVHLSDLQDSLPREALDAASVVRRTTQPLLQAMLPDVNGETVFRELARLPFFETARDGLHMHDAVQEVVAASFKAADPERFSRYRQDAWRLLSGDVREPTKAEIWRHNADLLYLIDEPLVREAFFPSGLQPLAIEQAISGDGSEIKAIIDRHEGPRSARVMNAWWSNHPEFFHVAKDDAGRVVGFYLLFEPEEADAELIRSDPVSWALVQQLRNDPIPKKQAAMFCRRWLDAETGDKPSLVIHAFFMDVKGYYVAMRPSLRRLYCTATQHDTYWPLFEKLRFRNLPDQAVDVDGRQFTTAVLDFGPRLFPGWMSRLVGSELGVGSAGLLDEDSCELKVEGKRIPLTKLEFGVMRHFEQHEGEVVSRASLLESVWGYDSYISGSNVVDAKIWSLRKKLGDYAPTIETVSGMGYRFRQD
jgi:hypothetical protein